MNVRNILLSLFVVAISIALVPAGTAPPSSPADLRRQCNNAGSSNAAAAAAAASCKEFHDRFEDSPSVSDVERMCALLKHQCLEERSSPGLARDGANIGCHNFAVGSCQFYFQDPNNMAMAAEVVAAPEAAAPVPPKVTAPTTGTGTRLRGAAVATA